MRFSDARLRVRVGAAADIGGLTPMRKLATLCEFFGARIAMGGRATQMRLIIFCTENHYQNIVRRATIMTLPPMARFGPRCTARATAARWA